MKMTYTDHPSWKLVLFTMKGGYDEDEDLAQFVSLANMCRDEQLFNEYVNQLVGQTNMGTDEPCAYEGSGSGTTPEEMNPEKQSKQKQKTVVVEERQVNTADFGDAEMLNDTLGNSLRNASDDEEEGDGERKRKVRYRPFNLTNECPKWEVGDVFGDREHFRDALRQYAVMTKRPIKTTQNDGKRYKAGCKGKSCEWYVTLSRMPAYSPNDYVVTALQDKQWVVAYCLGCG